MSKDPKAIVSLDVFEAALVQQEKGIPVPLLHMDGKSPLGVTILVAGPDSEHAAKARAILAQELVERESLEPLTPEEQVERANRFLALITLDWTPKVSLGGVEMGFTVENATLIYRKFRFIKNQVDLAAGNRSAFLAASLNSSPTP